MTSGRIGMEEPGTEIISGWWTNARSEYGLDVRLWTQKRLS